MMLKDKVVIISGIGPGLGQERAPLAGRVGASGLASAARPPARLEAGAQAIEKVGLGTKVRQVPTDGSGRDQCRNLVERTVEAFGRIDALINSAYVPGRFTPTEEADLDSWREAMEVNLFGTMNLTLETVEVMQRKSYGSNVMANYMDTRRTQ